MKYKQEIIFALTLIFCVIFTYCGQFLQDCEQVQDEVLRLHIVANSNSIDDQNLKLQVRDRILNESQKWFEESNDKTSSEGILQENLSNIAKIACDEISQKGYNYTVKVELCRENFPQKYYQNFVLPAGKYDALRVLIGDAVGENWWCLLFPSLCVPSASAEKSQDWFSDNNLESFQNVYSYEPRFALVELFNKFADFC